MIRENLKPAFDYHESLARAIYESSALYFGHTLLSKRNGDLPAKLVFVSDVPEVHGGAVTGVPFCDEAHLNGLLKQAPKPTRTPDPSSLDEHSDATPPAVLPVRDSPAARRFWDFAKPFGFERPDAKRGWQGHKTYVAYLLARHPCTPERGHRAPSSTEIKIGLQLLNAQLHLAQPRLLVPLGGAAAKAVAKLLRLSERPPVAKELAVQADWGPVMVFALTHPRPKERLHRPDWQQKLDWRKLAKLHATLR